MVTRLRRQNTLKINALQDDNAVLRTWDPTGDLQEPAVREGILPHHEVLLRLDAMDLDRGNETPLGCDVCVYRPSF